MIISKEMVIISNIMRNYLKIPVVFAEQDSIKPKGSYISIYMIDENPVGRSKKTIDDKGMAKYIQMYDLELCFDCIGKNANELAKKSSNMWPLESIQQNLKENKLSWRKSLRLKNTSSIYDENYIPRVTFEAYFYIKNEEFEQQYTIEKVKINGIN